jgi:methylmalonic aciduria homocystinuria type C protein
VQRLAERAGFAPLSSGRLSAHPVYGPWFALRAVVVFDVDGPDGPAPFANAPCAGCDAPCRVAFEHALAVSDARSDPALLHERWRPWLAVRDACPVGRDWRYSEEQILYHYARRWS